MAFRGSKNKKEEGIEEKVLDVDASMQGKISFRDPVNLKINGEFEGDLDTKGKLMINKNATVNAEIRGEVIEISGTVNGNIFASESLKLKSSAKVKGNLVTPVFSVEDGAIFNGQCDMKSVKIFDKEPEIEKSEISSEEIIGGDFMDVGELAKYIDIDEDSILKLIDQKKIPVKRINDNWKFDKVEIDRWISSS